MRNRAFLGTWALLSSLTGCGEQSSDDNGDADSDVDTDTDTDADTGDAIRLDYLDLTTPDLLHNIVIANLIQHNVDDFTLNWLIQLDPPSGATCGFTTGAALTAPPDCANDCTDFTFETDYPPSTGTGDCSETDFRIPSGTEVIASVDIPIHGDVFIVLPLREAALTGAWGASRPRATGAITAKITLADAVDIPIEDLQETLCGLLGDDGGEAGNLDDDCLNLLACDAGETPPDPDWVCDDPKDGGNPPDSDVDGEPAWIVGGEYEANFVNLAE